MANGPTPVSYTPLDVYKRQVMQGVTIGDGTVIGAGSVVTRDIPAGVIAFGNPCRVIRPVTEDDRITEVV